MSFDGYIQIVFSTIVPAIIAIFIETKFSGKENKKKYIIYTIGIWLLILIVVSIIFFLTKPDNNTTSGSTIVITGNEIKINDEAILIINSDGIVNYNPNTENNNVQISKPEYDSKLFKEPAISPAIEPTLAPTKKPSPVPTITPVAEITPTPTIIPTIIPTEEPTPTSTIEPIPANTPITTQSPTSVPANVTEGQNPTEGNNLMTYVNKYRTDAGIPALTWNSNLEQTAQNLASMFAIGGDGVEVDISVEVIGRQCNGAKNAQKAVSDWITGNAYVPSESKKLLDSGYTQIGGALYYLPNGNEYGYHYFWVICLQ